MKLFGKKSSPDADIIRLRQSFSRLYLDCNQLLINSFIEMGLTGDELAEDSDIQSGLLVLHSTILTISFSSIKDREKTQTASELVSYFEDMMVKDFNISSSELNKSKTKAFDAYMKSLTEFAKNSPATNVPILSAAKTLASLTDFYINKGQLNMMQQLPLVEQEILTRYKQYWSASL